MLGFLIGPALRSAAAACFRPALHAESGGALLLETGSLLLLE